jgi:hypothetical protein
MKTFSAMSTPDKLLTIEAYQQMIYTIELRIEMAKGLPLVVTEKICLQARRLKQLMEALEQELLAE